MKRSILLGFFVLAIFSFSSIALTSAYLVIDDPGGSTDYDGDGLSNVSEDLTYHTNKYDSDTDDDGLNDYKECIVYHTNPLVKDTDGDSLNDKDEITYGFNPNYVEATHLFVHNGKVYCGVAYLAWVSDYTLWYYGAGFLGLIDLISLGVMTWMLDGDLSLDALDGSTSSSYNYVDALKDRGFYVITDSNFNSISYISNFVTAYNFAKQYNTRLFALTYTHGLPVNLDIPLIKGNWMTYLPGFELGPSTFAEINLLISGTIPEIVFYAAPCYSMTTMAASITLNLMTHTSNPILFGTFNPGTQSAVSRFLNYGIKYTPRYTVYNAYWLSESATKGFIGSHTYILPTI